MSNSVLQQSQNLEGLHLRRKKPNHLVLPRASFRRNTTGVHLSLVWGTKHICRQIRDEKFVYDLPTKSALKSIKRLMEAIGKAKCSICETFNFLCV